MLSVNPFVRYAGIGGSSAIEPVMRRAADNRIFYFLSGEGEFTVAGKKTEIKKGRLVYVPAAVSYKIAVKAGSELSYIAVNFDFSQENSSVTVPYDSAAGSVAGFIRPPAQFSEPIVLSSALAYERALDKIAALFLSGERYFREKASARLKLMLYELISGAHEAGSAAPEILAYVKDNFDQPLTVSEVAKRFNYHPNHLSRLVKKLTGLPFKEFVIRYRINAARSMLLSTGLTVTEIGVRCGFSSPAYFSKTFLSLEGCSPREYRVKMKNII